MSEDFDKGEFVNSPLVTTLGAILGVVLLLAGLGFVYWIEDTSIRKAVSLEKAAGSTKSVSADRVEPANEGKPVHMTGQAVSDAAVDDPAFGISDKALRLTREVEVYCWKENKKETKKDKNTSTSWSYDKIWTNKKPPKIEGPEKDKYKNPNDKTYPDQQFSNPAVKVGAFTLTADQVGKLLANEVLPVTEAMLATMPDDLKGQGKVTPDGLLFVGVGSPAEPALGDVRIRYKVARPQTVSLVARQKGTTFDTAGEAVSLLQPGTHSAQDMIKSAGEANQLVTWVMRGAGCLGLALGLWLVFRRQVSASAGIPPAGVVANVGYFLLGLLICLPLTAAAAGGRWVTHDTLIGSGLLGGGLVVVLVLIVITSFVKPGLFGGSGGKKASAKEREELRAIALDPENKERRLVFAAALEKKGNPQGEFIRLDHELESLPPDDEGRENLYARWAELLQAHGRMWFAPLRALRLEPKVVGTFYAEMWMHHGIIDQVLIDLAGILPEKADRLFAAAPGLRILEFHNIRTEPGLGGWKDTMYKPKVPAIMKLPHLKQIGVLRMSSLQLTTDDLEAIATSPNLENLTELDFNYNKVGPEGAVLVADSETLKRLRVLELRACEIGEEGAVALAKSANLAKLIGLNLGANAIGPKGAAALAASAHLKHLQTLALDDNELGTAGAQAVAGSPHFRQLTTLDLGRNEIGPEGALALAKSPNLAKLTTLKLNDTKLGGMGLRYLASSPHPSKLKILELDSNEIDDSGAKTLGVCPVIKELEELSLSYNKIGDIGMTALAAWPGLARITKLKLRENKIGAAGVKALAASPHLRGLKDLDLSNNNVGVAGARALAGSPILKNLEYLWIDQANLTEEGEEVLRKRFGDVVRLS